MSCCCSIFCILVIFIEFLYPISKTITSLSKNIHDYAIVRQWLVYWAVFYSIYLIEKLTYILAA